jgi:two-component system sporulation sensor kinase C
MQYIPISLSGLKPAGAVPAATLDDRWFRAVANYTIDWESWHAPDGRLIWVNPAVERITGYSVEECLSMKDYPLPMVDHNDRRAISDVLTTARGRTTGESVEFRSVHRNGEMRWMSLSWQPMYEDEGGYLGIRTSIRDITDRRNLRDQLRLHGEHLEQLVQERTARLRQLEQRQRQMEKLAALGQLAAGVAHEINNPLAGMRNAFELFKSGLSPQHEHYELLALIDREIERISAIIQQMYQLYRRSPQRPSAFSLSQILGEIGYLLENVAVKRGVKLQCELGTDPVDVYLSEGEVKQILYNLIRNAIQVSSAGETVKIHTTQDENEVAVHVRDRGPGIPDDIATRIFEPFFTTKQGDAESGMGLGLSVSRSLIDAMGGRIDVSTRIGEGTEFLAVFPRRVDIQPSINQ